MQTGSQIADNRSELLTKQAEALIGRPGIFVADQIAPNISRADLVLGRYFTYQDVAPMPDQLGELMEPNILDIYKKPDSLDFVIEDHELQARVSRRFVSEMRENGLDESQVNALVVRELVQKVRAMREVTTFNLTTNASNYATGMSDSTAKGWNQSAGDPYGDIMEAIGALDGAGAPTDSIYMAASPIVWSAITAKLASRFAGIQARITPDDVAGIFGAKAVVARYQLGGQFVAGDTFQIYSRPEVVADDSLTAWRTVNAGMSGNPEPTVYTYWPEGHSHRYYVVGCYHDYTVIATGAAGTGTDAGKQRFGYLFGDVLS